MDHDHIGVGDLTRADARRDATSLAAPIDAIEQIYPGAVSLVRVKFRLA
jgi:hypothetical protein